MNQEPSAWITYGNLVVLLSGTVIFFAGVSNHAFVIAIIGAVLAIASFVVHLVLLVT
jgi:hypothetical protein